MKALMALMQIRQQEDALRDRTGVLDQQRSTDQHYNEETRDTANQQEEVRAGVEKLRSAPEFPVPSESLAPVSKAMQETTALLNKPDTGDLTIGTETDAVNMLDEIILAQAKKSGKGMSSLMRMMGVGHGNTPGGSTAGGDTDKPNIHVSGSRSGAVDEARHVVQAAGNGGAPLPAEFREAIQNYQRAIEQEGKSK